MQVLPLCLVAAVTTLSEASECLLPPPSITPFTSTFNQPAPPLVKPEFESSYIQHKWDLNKTNSAAGYILNLPSQGLVRAYVTSKIGLLSSQFNYSNVPNEGLVDNIVATYLDDSENPPSVWRGYANSNFPIFEETILLDAGAVFAGLVKRRIVQGQVAAWNIMYQGVIPVTIYLDNCDIIVGYDYFTPTLRTRVITEFFNIQIK
ncbi:hypothetical protein EJ07DRAFT_128118 [Lizonia empirigonia]|nr:hypothetical protein EJ07DRAFT_128118 [Lizonia empirigonia]